MNKFKKFLSYILATVFIASLSISLTYGAPVPGGGSGQMIDRVDILQFRDDKTIQVLEPTSGNYADSIYIEPDDTNVSYFRFYPSATGVATLIDIDSTDADVGFGIQARGAGVIDLKSNTEVNNQSLGIKYVDAGAAGTTFTMYQDSASPAANDVIANIIYSGEDDIGGQVTYGDVEVQIKDPSNGAEASSIFHRAIAGGALEIFLELSGVDDALVAYKNTDIQGSFAVIEESDGAVGATVEILKDTASPAASDVIGTQSWISQDSATNDTTYAETEVQILDPADGNEDGFLARKLMMNGVSTQYLSVDGNAGDMGIEIPILFASSVLLEANTGITYGDNTDQNLDILTADVLAGDYKLQWVTADGEFVLTAPLALDSYLIVGGELEVEGTTTYTPSSDQARADDSTITIANTIVRVAGDGAAAVLDTNPAVEDGAIDGQIVYIQGTSDANTVQIADAVNTALSGGQAFTLGQGDVLTLVWDDGDSLWYEISRSDN